MKRAAIYTRVSSDPHGAGRSVAEQRDECTQLCRREGWQVVETFTDNDRSASRHARTARPAYRALVELVSAGGCDVLVTWEASRFQRDLAVYVQLRDLCHEHGVLWSYSGRTYDLSRTDDRFATGLDALLAEQESDRTRDRVLRTVRAQAAKGRPHGKLLYGYRRTYDTATGALLEQVARDDQAAIVREAARRVAGGETTSAIARDLNRRGVPAPRGGQWDLTQIRRLVTNPGYIGKRTHRGAVVGDATWPPLVDEITFYACVQRMTDPARSTRREDAVRHLLSGLVACGVCGGRLHVLKNRGYPSYQCQTRYCVAIRTTKLEGFVTAVVLERLSRPDAVELLAADRGDASVRAALAEVAEKRSRLDGFYDAAAAGKLTPAALARIEARLLPEIDAAERRARTASVSPILRDVARPDIADIWPTLAHSQQREVIDTLMSIRLLPVGRGRRTFDPRRVEITPKRG